MESTKLARMNRRSWLRTIAAAAGLTTISLATTEYLQPQGDSGARTVDLGPIDEVISDGTRRVVNVNGRMALLSRRADVVTALDLTCTHAGCPLAFDAKTQRIRCACHGGAFAVTGEPVAGPPRRPLDQLECRTENGRLYIRTQLNGDV
ncbi:MAG: Rieske (2Fe-2S) protein [Candidatus Kapabacteria bacterium]|nr:Rieske (2Fe-2S) protein [Candidatus Kapabacteria bacterium]